MISKAFTTFTLIAVLIIHGPCCFGGAFVQACPSPCPLQSSVPTDAQAIILPLLTKFIEAADKTIKTDTAHADALQKIRDAVCDDYKAAENKADIGFIILEDHITDLKKLGFTSDLEPMLKELAEASQSI